MIKPLTYDAAVAELGGRELESGRVRRVFDASAAYVELLDLAATLPIDRGPKAVARSVVDTLSRVLVSRAIGASVVPPGSDHPIVELALPGESLQPGRDPTRLFPELSDELILPLDRLAGSTLHVAAVEGKLDDPDELVTIKHAAALLASGTRNALAISSRKPATDEVSLLRAQLIQAEKLASLGQIVAGVVHELANPVTSIVAGTDFLLRRASASNEATEDVEQVKRIGIAANRILKFIRDLIEYARPARETATPVALEEIVSQARAFTEHELERHGVVYSAEFAEGVPRVLGQEGPLTQLFVNLFTNAAHAMGDQGGQLLVRARHDDPLLVIEVTDTGVGIPAETIGSIFDPFFTTKEAGLGTGLGLSIVREIVEAHRGSVDALSTPGEGTTFVVRLPAYQDD